MTIISVNKSIKQFSDSRRKLYPDGLLVGRHKKINETEFGTHWKTIIISIHSRHRKKRRVCQKKKYILFWESHKNLSRMGVFCKGHFVLKIRVVNFDLYPFQCKFRTCKNVHLDSFKIKCDKYSFFFGKNFLKVLHLQWAWLNLRNNENLSKIVNIN